MKKTCYKIEFSTASQPRSWYTWGTELPTLREARRFLADFKMGHEDAFNYRIARFTETKEVVTP